ncbi:MAG: hypothetical protein ACMUIU_01130 [bacterium]
MIPFEELRNRLQNPDVINNPLKRHLWIVAILTEALKTIGERPVLVGGETLEYYIEDEDKQNKPDILVKPVRYTTGGIDIVLPGTDEVNSIFSKLGFHKEGRCWIREDIDVTIEAKSFDLAGGDDSLIEVKIEDMSCFIIGFEDMIIDRLDSYIHEHLEDARNWIKGVLSVHGQEINKEYLFRKAKKHSSEEALNKIFEELGEDRGI